MRLCYLFLSFILFSIPVQAADYVAIQHAENQSLKLLSLSDSLDLALKANPDIAVAIREREAIEGVKVQAATRPNPFVSTSIQDTRSATRQIYLQLNQEIELGNNVQPELRLPMLFIAKQMPSWQLSKLKFTPMWYWHFMNYWWHKNG